MPRNASGVYTLPAGNPVTPLTVITTSWANPTLSDIGTEITNSLSRDGFGGMRAPFRLFDGTQALPGLAFSNEPGVGWYRESASLSHIVTANTKVLTFKPNRTVFPDQSEYRGVNAYKLTGSRSWRVQNLAGRLSITPSANIDAEDWDASKTMAFDFNGQFVSGVATGTAPFSITSTTLVPNLYVQRAVLSDSTTVNANLTGPITSVGNATSVASQTGIGSTFVMNTSPTLVTPVLGVATATSLNGLTITATTGTLTLTNGKTLSVLKTMSFNAADDTGVYTLPTGTKTLVATDVAALTSLVSVGALNSGSITNGFASITLNGSVAGGKLLLTSESGDDVITANLGGVAIVGNSVVGYPALGYNIASGNAANTWRFGGADNAAWLQMAGGSSFSFFNNSNAPSDGGLITNRLLLNISTAGNGTWLGSDTATAFIPTGSTVPANGMYLSAANEVSWATNSTKRLSLTSDGRLFGTALHNNAGSVTGTANQYVASGTYTPTLTNGANVAASTAFAIQWIRVGNVVHVGGRIDVDPTSTATLTTIEVSLPIASNFTNTQNCGGAGTWSVGVPVNILGSIANDRAVFNFTVNGTANDVLTFSFTYVIQ